MATNSTNTNITLVDCNRANADEVSDEKKDKGKSNAIWTNKISAGLKLNAGDKVSVAYTSINEIGCGSSTLETTGEYLTDKIDLHYTDITDEAGDKFY